MIEQILQIAEIAARNASERIGNKVNYEKPWAMRMRFRLPTRLNLDTNAYGAIIHDRQVVFGANPTFRDSEWISAYSDGFSSELEARRFAQVLESMILAYMVQFQQGIDLGNDKSSSSFSDDIKSLVYERFNVDLRDPVHGIDVWKKDRQDIYLSFTAQASVLQSGKSFFSNLCNIEFNGVMWTKRVEHAAKLFAAGNMAQHPLSALILSVSCVEYLSESSGWSHNQIQLIEDFVKLTIACDSCSADEKVELTKALKNLKSVSLRQSVKRELSRLDMLDEWPVWEACYKVRSSAVHGRSNVSFPELGQSVIDARRIASQVVMRNARELASNGSLAVT